MAGTKRFAAKLLICGTVLATGGAGAYHYTSGGDWSRLWNGRAGAATAKLVADDTKNLSATDLDAVASSWATASDARGSDDSAITPAARSADATLASVEPPASRHAVGDRYAVTAVSPTPETLAASEMPAAGLAEPEPTAAPEYVTSAVEDQASDTAAEPTPALARGQDPNNEGATAGSVAARTAEPQALEVPASTADLGAVAQRARNAFRDEAAIKTPASGNAGSRYATAPAATASQSLDPRKDSVPVNPFAAQPATIPTSAGTSEPRELAPMVPSASERAQGNLAAGFGAQPPANSARSARATYSQSPSTSQPPSDYRAGSEGQPLETAPSTSNGMANATQSYSGGTSSAVEGTGKPGERALEGLQKPALVIQKLAPPQLQVGKPAKFIVQVRNVGGQVAEDVIIRDEVPHGTKLVSTTPTAESDGSRLTWQLNKLSPGEERSIEMQVMPTAEGEIGSVATVTYSAQASVKARCTMPQLALRLTAPNQVMIGGEQRVKIELRNPGSGDATGVMLFENVPQNLKHAAGPTLEFEIGTLRAGETRELELVLKAEKAGKVVNVLNARAEGNLQVQQQVDFEVIAPALSVEVNGPERRYLERPATYEVTVANPGTAVAHDVQLITKLPKGMRFVRANNMGEYDANTHAVYWSLAELPEGEHGTVELVAMPIETGPQTLEVEGKAQQGLADQKQQQIIVEGLAAIMFEVRDLEDPIEVGGETGYEIRVVNQGTKAATNVKVSINLPPGMQLISAEGETQHAARGSTIVFEPLAQLAPKADTVYRVKAQGMQAGDQRVTVEVNTDDLGQPIRREESTRVFGDE